MGRVKRGVVGQREWPGLGGRMKRRVKRIEGRDGEELAGSREFLWMSREFLWIGTREVEDSGAL